MARLNDTNALVERPYRVGGSTTQSVRKIDNGFLVCESSYDDDTGVSKYSERFVADVPGGDGMRGNRSGVGPEGLGDVKKYLGDAV